LLIKYNKDKVVPQPVVRAELKYMEELMTQDNNWKVRIKPFLFEGSVQESLPSRFHSLVRFDIIQNDYYDSFLRLLGQLYDQDYYLLQKDFEDQLKLLSEKS